MNEYKIKIELKSPTLPSAAGSELQYDSEPHFDTFGFPYLPGKTYKGLIRESTKEVLEITCNDDKILSSLFGRSDRSGSHFSKLQFYNFHIANYIEKIRPYLFQNEPTLQEIKRFKSYFTAAVSRTAIENGVAKKGSLRTFSTLIPGKVGHLESDFIADLTGEEELLLIRSNLHLTRIGLARNRGLGLVKSRFHNIGTFSPVKKKPNWPQEANEVAVKVTLLSPLINNESGGDNFNIESGDIINGNKLIGLYASEYLKTSKAEDTFADYFLNEKLRFSPLVKNNAMVIPRNIQFSKYDSSNSQGKPSTFYNIFGNKTDALTKPYGGYLDNGDKIKVKKVRNLHTSRPIRTAGRAFKEEGNGEIFAIEALSPGQVFYGTISGEQYVLENFFIHFAELNNTRIGKSKYTQYGRVKIEMAPKKAIPSNISSPSYLLIETPLALLNSEGNPDFTAKIFKSYLPNITLDFTTSILAEQKIRGYRSDWKSPTDIITALKPGSVIKISQTDSDHPTHFQIGEYTSMGLGRVRLLTEGDMEEYQKLLAQEVDRSQEVQKATKPSELQSILNAIESEISEQEFAYKAIKSAYRDFQNNKKLRSIKSNKISRLIFALKNCNNLENLKKFFSKDNQSGFKESGKELEEKGVFHMISQNTPEGASFEQYWTAYFTQFRKLKKSN